MMHPERKIIGFVWDEIRTPAHHTRFAPARRPGPLPGFFKKPCGVHDIAQSRCLKGMLIYATGIAQRFYGEQAAHLVRRASEKIEDLLLEYARTHGYASIQHMNDWGGYRQARAAVEWVKARI